MGVCPPYEQAHKSSRISEAGHPNTGRGDERPGRGVGEARAGGTGPGKERPHRPDDRPPAEHNPERGCNSRPGGGSRPRKRHLRGAHGLAQRPVQEARQASDVRLI
jgi:hypothetical protein